MPKKPSVFGFVAAQFLYDRTATGRQLASFMATEEIPEEDEEAGADGDGDPLQNSANYTRPKLNDLEQGTLAGCMLIMTELQSNSVGQKETCTV